MNATEKQRRAISNLLGDMKEIGDRAIRLHEKSRGKKMTREEDLLKEKIAELERRLLPLRVKKNKIENARTMKALEKKYLGKHFRYKNSYGSGQSWWLYFKVLKVVDSITVEVVSAQKTTLGIEIETKPTSIHEQGKIISRAEFNKHFKSLSKQLLNPMGFSVEKL